MLASILQVSVDGRGGDEPTELAVSTEESSVLMTESIDGRGCPSAQVLLK